jgi:acyl-CoA thioester hydrolase
MRACRNGLASMTTHYKTTRRVEFRDTDAAGMAHFSVFFVFMEQAEHELLRHLGLSVMMSDELGPISFPRVAARCDYQRAVKFEDVLDIEAAVVRVGKKSITYEFNFSHDNRPVASGQTTTVCCRFQTDGVPVSIAIPKWIAEKLAPPPAG